MPSFYILEVNMAIKWTYEKIVEEAKKYETRREFKKESLGYMAATNRGILDEVCQHMKETPKKKIKWSDDMIVKEAKKYQTRGEFAQKSLNAYNSARNRGILDDVCSHMDSVLINWTHEMILEEAKKYQTRNYFKRNSKAYAIARERCILDDVCSHMDSVLINWTHEMILEEAKKHKTRYDFQKNNSKAYEAAKTRGILDEVCSHMEVLFVNWKDEIVLEEAKKYQTRTEFALNCKYAYNIARERCILDDVCSHMETKIIKDVIYMWNTIEIPDVWKIGISNNYRYEIRVNKVISQTKNTLHELIWKQVDNPRKIERDMLSLGEPFIFENVVDGRTEFRYLSEADEKKAREMIRNATYTLDKEDVPDYIDY